MLYGKRIWSGGCTSPLLFAGQYEDAESGWAYNRFLCYTPWVPTTPRPLGLAPLLASTLGYVDHAANWADILGLDGVSHIVEVDKALESIARDLEALRTVHSTAAHGQSCPPGQSGRYENHAEQKLLNYAKQNSIQPAELHSVYNFCSNRCGSIPGCEQVLSRNGFMTVSPHLDTAYPVRFTQDGVSIIRSGMR